MQRPSMIPGLGHLLVLLAVGVHGCLGELVFRRQQQPVPGVGIPLDAAVLRTATDNLAIAQNANMQARQSMEATMVHQQALLAAMSANAAEKEYETVKGLAPAARAKAVEARMWAAKALYYAEHATEAAAATKMLPQWAAKKADEAVLGWIREDAKKAAEAAAVTPVEAQAHRHKQAVEAVAAAAEPYHLAVLRTQKFVQETYEKAKSSMSLAQQLRDKAFATATDAQALQAEGEGFRAMQLMGTAHQTIRQAENARQWALKFYGQANEAQKGIGAYQMGEVSAAETAAQSTQVNPPARLPMPPVEPPVAS